MLLPLVLGSSSRRRKAILEDFRFPFTVVSPNFDERKVAFCGDPIAYTQKLATQKAYAVSALSSDSDCIIITADTIVVYEGHIFNKPQDKVEAIDMLKTLRNQTHTVITSLVVLHNKKLLKGSESSEVSLTMIPDHRLESYIETVGTLSNCGAYDLCNGGGLIFKKIHGCFYNIQGLPIQTLKYLLEEFNIDLWDYSA
ncbi:Septum formation protein Maf,Maf-like protein,Nucleotide-binding protein implicated in inhibition of septum formation,septum formation protein Maf,Maf-like protein [Chlamydia serpentis]|uniref:Nucleoside triphosphate pyrophosphatase n=1 Tax=Chlamydia serpentis TaxID=1967782 RepID=A0A2R8FA49_9CHLA|nr:Maf family nucleotide pyrophosphatase [Chlamydia serpentis]SPN73202.1 Septum formation protein Maf,Maf-like protein,Nucleotide-binding protein implicated in inhibition of septum formation,septum formation protein Maf,Maf-like protein [Chlamydia serpentis]